MTTVRCDAENRVIQIREAIPADAAAIAELNRVELGYRLPAEETRDRLCTALDSGKDKVFVAETEGRVVGYVHANDYDVLYFPHMKNIMGIAVDKNFKRRGIGQKLIEAVEAWARNTNAAGIRLVSGAERKGAHEFYRRCGFSSGKEQINFKKMFD